jgi:hypothetical protein
MYLKGLQMNATYYTPVEINPLPGAELQYKIYKHKKSIKWDFVPGSSMLGKVEVPGSAESENLPSWFVLGSGKDGMMITAESPTSSPHFAVELFCINREILASSQEWNTPQESMMLAIFKLNYIIVSFLEMFVDR